MITQIRPPKTREKTRSRCVGRFVGFVLAIAVSLSGPRVALGQVTTPEQEFGHRIGADYQLPNYTQLQAYWEKLARESDRMALQSIGNTEEGRPQLMAILTSPANHRNLDRYKEIARRLTKAESVSEEEARALADEGKAVVWIDGGLHATEVLGAQQLMEFVYQMVSRNDEETLRFLDDVVVLAVHANPDGMELVSNWYMRNPTPEERSTGGVPVLYEKYAGHDNNRDFYMSNLAETTNMNRVMYREWYPQIVYNHHQTGPAGTVMFAPPFRDPPNHNLDPLILTSLDQVGSAMHARMIEEGKGGTTMRSGASYSTWWNGGLRTTPYFKNMIGLLTETIGNPTPIEIPFIPNRQLPRGDIPFPVEPGVWHFRQSVDYSQTANRAVLDYASRNKDRLLVNIWRMGTNSIERGNRDHWTIKPKAVENAANQIQGRGARADYDRLLRAPENRDPRGYILTASQRDFNTAGKFVNSLLKNGVDVHRATTDFTVSGTRYPAGSYVVKAAQAFRPHVIDMFEPQDHPNDFAYPGAPPTPPYDATGWTLAYQMGVEFDRVLEGFDGPFELIEGLVDDFPGIVAGAAEPGGYLLDHAANDAFIAINRLMAEGHDVFWLTDDFVADGMDHDPGTFFVPEAPGVRDRLETIAEEVGLSVHAIAARPSGEALELRPVRIGLWDRYGGSMPSGWTRMILEDFEFPFEVVYPPELDEGDLIDKFDVLVFPDGGIPAPPRAGGFGGRGGGFGGRGGGPQNLPAEYQNRIGSVTPDTTIPQIREFIEAGGTVITIGSSTNLGYHLGLPISNHLTDDQGNRLSSEEYYIPGTVLNLKLEQVSPVVHGLGDRVDVLFDASPVFRLDSGAQARGLTNIGWFDGPESLRSGWAWGQDHLEGGSALIEADIGEGKLFLFGPRITFRGQAHGTFPLLFNGIYYGTAQRVTLPST